MKIAITLYFISCSFFIFAQQNQVTPKPNLEHLRLIGSWVFQSMTTITQAKREEIKIVYNDKNNVETLSFSDSGTISFNVINDGVEKNGEGIWYADGSYVTILVESDTTYGAYQIEDSVLTIVTNTEESTTAYEYSTILKYRMK